MAAKIEVDKKEDKNRREEEKDMKFLGLISKERERVLKEGRRERNVRDG